MITGCSSKDEDAAGVVEALRPTDASIIDYHVEICQADVKEFVSRLYARNPKYEKDLQLRRKKIDSIFKAEVRFSSAAKDNWTSREFLTAAFAQDMSEDRIYLLGVGLVKSIKEAYGLEEMNVFWTGLQVPLEQLQRLHFNLSQVNWRLKTYRDQDGSLLFLTNGMGENGYLNMGYEVLMTRILTRVEDDIYLRGGLPEKYMFRMSTIFLSILM